MFRGRELLIASMHHKDQVIAPILEKSLGVNCRVPAGFNTDQFGTFAGEVERKTDAVSTARAKCERALDLFGGDLVIASEGSFGPHPHLFLINANEEFLVLIDRKNGLEIIGRHVTWDTNFLGAQILSLGELSPIAEQAKFPSHGLIVRNRQSEYTYLVKGLTDWASLYTSVWTCLNRFGEAFVETDMRAHMNPTRMEAIRMATDQLVKQIESRCPECEWPGFGISETVTGLPCQLCGSPTRAPLKNIYSCKKCGFENSIFFPSGQRTESPLYCDYCNP
jgi:hypothetical protein